jgi:hypothetical protein
MWCGAVWCGVVRCGVVWCGAVWCGAVWCGVVWCGVVWCGVVVWCVAGALGRNRRLHARRRRLRPVSPVVPSARRPPHLRPTHSTQQQLTAAEQACGGGCGRRHRQVHSSAAHSAQSALPAGRGDWYVQRSLRVWSIHMHSPLLLCTVCCALRCVCGGSGGAGAGDARAVHRTSTRHTVRRRIGRILIPFGLISALYLCLLLFWF